MSVLAGFSGMCAVVAVSLYTVSFAGTVTQSYVVLQFVSLLEGQEEGHFSIALSTLGVY
jgi:hypothetical protein